jgi:nucleotide-binding universal stress UspA family protein
MKTILAAIDFSSASLAVVRETARLARLSKSRVVLLHVSQPVGIPALAAGLGGAPVDVGESMKKADLGAARHLSRLCGTLRSRAIPTEAVQAAGFSAECILAQARECKADYIVVGSHGHTALYELIVGGTGGSVLRRATCPVIVVRPAIRKPAGAGRT